MKKAIFLSAIVFLGVLFGYSQEDTFIQFQDSAHQFTIIFVNKDKIAKSKARKKALEMAAKTIVKEGDRYFTIEEEGVVQIGAKEGNYEELPRNYYQEKIIESDFGSKEEAQSNSLPSMRIYLGYKVKIKSHKEKPFTKAKDACRYTRCNK